jgi:hypothetical protein
LAFIGETERETNGVQHKILAAAAIHHSEQLLFGLKTSYEQLIARANIFFSYS